MRTVLSGLVALLACLTLNVGIASAQTSSPDREKGMSMAPAMIAENQIPCKLTDALALADGKTPSAGVEVDTSFVEIACDNDLGYVLLHRKDNTFASFDCISTSSRTKDGNDHPLKCVLPGNAKPYEGLQTTMKAAGSPCVVTQAAAIGMTQVATLYEVACADADGFLVVLPRPRIGKAEPQLVTCYSQITTPQACQFTTKEQSIAWLVSLASKGDKPCAPTDQRYVTRSQTGSRYYEFACPDNTGFMVETKAGGGYARSIPCGLATGIGGGCTLTEAREDRTADNALYTGIAKRAGFNCDVSKYGIFPRREGDPVSMEVLELACSNRPDSAVAYFGNTNFVVNCLQGRAEGYRCSYSEEAQSYPGLTAALKTKGRTSCQVSGARAVGGTDTETIVETACADGLPGYMIVFTKGRPTVNDALSCGQGAEIGGGCKLPTNQRKK